MKRYSIGQFVQIILCCIFFVFLITNSSVYAQDNAQSLKVISAKKIDATRVEIALSNNHQMIIDFYGENIFRLFQDNDGGKIKDPEAKPIAKILVDNPRKPVSIIDIKDENGQLFISTSLITLLIDKKTSLFKIINNKKQTLVVAETAPVVFAKDKVTLTLNSQIDQYFYGGGVQNGRFSHK